MGQSPGKIPGRHPFGENIAVDKLQIRAAKAKVWFWFASVQDRRSNSFGKDRPEAMNVTACKWSCVLLGRSRLEPGFKPGFKMSIRRPISKDRCPRCIVESVSC